VSIRRRDFITLLGGAAAAWPIAARAQQPSMPVIGLLSNSTAAEGATRVGAVLRGLNETGFVEGRNVVIEYRWTEGRFDRLADMAADLVGRKVAVILTQADGIRAGLTALTQTIPIVFTTASDPVAMGLVASLNRPGGNVTGVTNLGVELVPKRLELLHELVPMAGTIALLVNPNSQSDSQVSTRSAEAAVRRLGLQLIVVGASTEVEVDRAFATAAQKGAGALLLGGDVSLNTLIEQIASLTLRHSMPTIAAQRAAVAAGQLISYGPDPDDSWRQAGVYVGRILKGEKPADLPVLQPTKFQLVINLKTARALGLTVPPLLLARADEVIE
jgi:putative ABC transport system substrate-binding protein